MAWKHYRTRSLMLLPYRPPGFRRSRCFAGTETRVVSARRTGGNIGLDCRIVANWEAAVWFGSAMALGISTPSPLFKLSTACGDWLVRHGAGLRNGRSLSIRCAAPASRCNRLKLQQTNGQRRRYHHKRRPRAKQIPLTFVSVIPFLQFLVGRKSTRLAAAVGCDPSKVPQTNTAH